MESASHIATDTELREVRCPKCNRLFMMADIDLGRAEIKCPKCGWLYKIQWPRAEDKPRL